MRRIFTALLLIAILFYGGNNEGATTMKESMASNNGLIEKIDAEELVTKLSKLNNNTTMDDVIAIFGIKPCLVAETNVDCWEYYAEDIVISLTGINLTGGMLYQATVSYMDCYFEVELDDHI